MTTAGRRGILAVVTALVLLGLGAGLGVVVGDALGIRTEPATQMSPPDAAVPSAQPAVAPPEFTVVETPDGARFEAAVASLRAAVEAAVEGGRATVGEASLTVVAPADHAGSDTGPEGGDAYRITGDATALQIEAETTAGAVRGVYDLAAAVRAGQAIDGLIGAHAASRLPLRMVDLGAVGVVADPAEWAPGTNYSHVSDAFREVYLAEPPYIDEDALAVAYEEWDAFLRHVAALGYNATAWPGFLEYAVMPGGVYPEGDEHAARTAALRHAFGPFWERAAALGIGVYLRTDMLALTPALNDYFTARFGSADTENPDLWQVYTDALDELYAEHPALRGAIIRIGEGGDIYRTPGWDYYSALAVRTVPAVQAMLEAFTAQAEAAGREVIFRTWSVGIGEVGDMHTSAASYEAVLGGISSPALIVSTKYTLGDFYSWLPLNDTLESGDHRRIIEFQSRREFEAFGSFPTNLGPEFQWALQALLAANPHIEGVWTWTQDGGPWRAGPMVLYLKAGFWQLSELNTMVAAALAQDPGADVGQVTVDWARRYFSDDPATVTAIAEAMTHAQDAIQHGLYVGAFAEQRVFALGLEPPPQMLLFEWDILTGDTATLDMMHTTIGPDRIAEANAEAARAVTTVEQMHATISGTDAATWRDPQLRQDFLDALDYEVDVLGLLGAYRAMFLHEATWHATLSAEGYDAWRAARDDFVARAAAHLEQYEGDVAHPAWNLTAAQLGVERGDRDLAMAWAARVLLVLALAWVVIGVLAARTRLVRRPGAAAARASWLGATRPWRARESTLGFLPLDRWLIIVVPVGLLVATRAVQTSLLSWTHLAVVFAAWVVFALLVRLFVGQRSPWPVISAVGGVVVLRCILTLAALSFTGPGGYWYGFWTSPTLRAGYIAIAFALFVWVFVTAGWALSTQLGARRATGAVLASVGGGLLVPSIAVGIVGLEQALTVWNDQLGLLPWGMARILGITTFLEIPAETPWYAAGFGTVLLVVGLVLALAGGRHVYTRGDRSIRQR
ncbi:hypothetical protein [Microbacterium sp.]|uniref:hypothetical protein n=1 Tax=Microbacterium sp. TaxID=51671 RepID=UPI0037C5927C